MLTLMRRKTHVADCFFYWYPNVRSCVAFESVVNRDICQSTPGFVAILTKKASRPMIGLLFRYLARIFSVWLLWELLSPVGQTGERLRTTVCAKCTGKRLDLSSTIFYEKIYHSGSSTAVQELDGLQFHFRCVQILALPKHSARWLQTWLNWSHTSRESTWDQRHTTELLQCFGRNKRNHPCNNFCWQDQKFPVLGFLSTAL